LPVKEVAKQKAGFDSTATGTLFEREIIRCIPVIKTDGFSLSHPSISMKKRG
jgi:hypothetical protein